MIKGQFPFPWFLFNLWQSDRSHDNLSSWDSKKFPLLLQNPSYVGADTSFWESETYFILEAPFMKENAKLLMQSSYSTPHPGRALGKGRALKDLWVLLDTK
jgi:hypothetical protein